MRPAFAVIRSGSRADASGQRGQLAIETLGLLQVRGVTDAVVPRGRRVRKLVRALIFDGFTWGSGLPPTRPNRVLTPHTAATGKGASPRGPRPPTGHRELLAKRSRARSSRSFCPPHANLRAETPEATGSGFPWKSATAEFTNPTGWIGRSSSTRWRRSSSGSTSRCAYRCRATSRTCGATRAPCSAWLARGTSHCRTRPRSPSATPLPTLAALTVGRRSLSRPVGQRLWPLCKGFVDERARDSPM